MLFSTDVFDKCRWPLEGCLVGRLVVSGLLLMLLSLVLVLVLVLVLLLEQAWHELAGTVEQQLMQQQEERQGED
jgi:uncharacterized membrane protein